MDTKLIEALNNQATHEFTAAMAYLAMSNWCSSEDFTGFSDFFKKQCEEEFEHAEKIQKHMLDRGLLPIIGSISAPKSEYQSLIEVAQTALKLEVENSKGIVAAYEVAMELKDYPSQIMLQWFIEEQVEEEAWANSMVTNTQRASCAGAMLDLDRHLTKIIGA